MAAKPKITQIIEVDRGWERIKRELKKLDKSYTAVGYFGHGGDPSNDLAARAAVNEYGAIIRVTNRMRGYLAAVLGMFLKKSTNVIRIPSRPFMRKTSAMYKHKLNERKVLEYNRILDGQQGTKQALSRLGEWYVGAIKTVILRVRFAPNSDITVKSKGSSRPLVSSGQLLNGATHKEKIR